MFAPDAQIIATLPPSTGQKQLRASERDGGEYPDTDPAFSMVLIGLNQTKAAAHAKGSAEIATNHPEGSVDEKSTSKTDDLALESVSGKDPSSGSGSTTTSSFPSSLGTEAEIFVAAISDAPREAFHGQASAAIPNSVDQTATLFPQADMSFHNNGSAPSKIPEPDSLAQVKTFTDKAVLPLAGSTPAAQAVFHARTGQAGDHKSPVSSSLNHRDAAASADGPNASDKKTPTPSHVNRASFPDFPRSHTNNSGTDLFQASPEAQKDVVPDDKITSNASIFTPATHSAQAQALAPEVRAHAPQVAARIASAVVQSGGGTTQIALNPEELGQVRVTLTTNDLGVVVSIIAERPETMDLIRRNIDILLQEFSELGQDEVAFSFGDDAADQSEQEHRTSHAGSTAHVDAEDPRAQPPMMATPHGGLDLKL